MAVLKKFINEIPVGDERLPSQIFQNPKILSGTKI